MSCASIVLLVSPRPQPGARTDCAPEGEGAGTCHLARVREHVADLRSAHTVAPCVRNLGLRPVILPVTEALADDLGRLRPQAVIPTLHGPLGRDGVASALVRELGIALVAPTPHATLRAADRALQRAVLERHNVPVPAYVHVFRGRRGEAQARACTQAIDDLGVPVELTGPRDDLRATASTRVDDPDALGDALAGRLSLRESVLVQRVMSGDRVRVVVFDGVVVGTVAPNGSLAAARRRSIERLALRAADVLELGRFATCVEILACDRHNDLVLDVDALPSLARDEVVARAAREAGTNLRAILETSLSMIGVRTHRRPISAPMRAAVGAP